MHSLTLRRRHWCAALCLCLCLGLGLAPALHAQTPATVAAASDLKFALEELVPQFEKATGHKLRLVFGSSGNF